MARNTPPTAILAVEPGEIPAAHTELLADEAAMRQAESAAMENAMMVATQVGYDGSLTLGAIEDEIRFFQRRTVEAILETGKRLLVMRELTPHGEFEKRVELLGFNIRTAQRFMKAASKTAKSDILSLLSKQVKNGSAFLELITHDDDSLKSLAEMDEIDRMGPSELRAALKEARETTAARDDVIKAKEETISKLELRATSAERRQSTFTDEEKCAYECAPLHDAINESMVTLLKMATEVKRLVEQVGGELVTEECFHAVLLPIKRALEIAAHNGLHIDLATLFDEQHDAPLESLQARAAGLTPGALQ